LAEYITFSGWVIFRKRHACPAWQHEGSASITGGCGLRANAGIQDTWRQGGHLIGESIDFFAIEKQVVVLVNLALANELKKRQPIETRAFLSARERVQRETGSPFRRKNNHGRIVFPNSTGLDI
jgi:hypothetical protein